MYSLNEYLNACIEYTLVLFALLYMMLLAYDLMNCTSIQTIYAHELPETDIVDRPDYIKFPVSNNR